MKIALIGAHGTGKTTMAHELVAELKKRGGNVEFLGEIARMCPLEINENTTRKSQEWIIYSQYVKEIEMEQKCETLVCDRSIFDGYAYYHYKFGGNKIIEDFVKEKIKGYDFLFKIPISNVRLKRDGKRSVNPKFQREIGLEFDSLLEIFSIEHYISRNINDILQTMNV